LKKLFTFLFILISIHFSTTYILAANNTIDYFIYNDTIYRLDLHHKVEKKSLVNLIGLLEITKQKEDTTFVNQTNILFNGLALYEIKDSSPEQVLAIEISNEFYLSTQTDIADVIYYVKEEQLENENTYSMTEQNNTKENNPEAVINEQQKIETSTIEEIKTSEPSEQTNTEQTSTEQVNEIITDIENTTADSTVQEVEVIEEVQATMKNIAPVPEETIKSPPTTVDEKLNDVSPTSSKESSVDSTNKKDIKKESIPTEPPIIEKKEVVPSTIVEPTHHVLGLEQQSAQENIHTGIVTAPAVPTTSFKETIVKNNVYFMFPMMIGVTFIILLTFITYKLMNKNENQ